MSAPLALVQARLSSSRLPGKVLLPLGDGAVLDQVLRRAAAFAGQVVVCTSEGADDDAIAAHCEKTGVACVRGPLEDIFARFRAALLDPRVERTPWFVRVTADCPLLSVPLARAVIAAAEADDELDYACVHLDRAPRGVAVEAVRTATFLALDPAGLDGPQREHVTPVLYEKPERFACLRLDVPGALRHPELRLTIDHPEDYALMQRLFEDPEVSAESAVARLLREPELTDINAHCEQRTVR